MRTGLILTALVAVTPVALAAQLPNIRMGQTIRDSLVRRDQKFPDGSRYKLYGFLGTKGDTVYFDLVSDDFDANLVLADASGNRLDIDDDGGDRCNARLQFVPPATGNYRVYANSSSQGELGEYRMSFNKGKAPTPADSTCRDFGLTSGTIEVGQTITGELTADDPELRSDSTHYKRYVLPVKPNQTFTADLESGDFDAYLWLTRSRGDKIVANDDGGGGCNSRLVYTTTDGHPLRLIVNTARPSHSVGQFSLRVTEGELPVDTKGNCRNTGARAQTASNRTEEIRRTIAVGASQQGALSSRDVVLDSDSTYAQPWSIEGRAGQTITIDLESDAFDAFLFLRGPGISGGRDFQDDDSGGNCHARLTATFPQTGEYEIVVNTAAGDHYATGPFTLSVTSGSKPRSVARCNRSGQ